MNRLIDACVDFSGLFSDFKERRRKLQNTMPNNNDHQGAANNQVSFLRNSSPWIAVCTKLNFESSNRNRKSSLKPLEESLTRMHAENVVI